jgi:membrane-bound lytic murein transglycosylase D
LIILITTGCAEKATTHAFIKEPSPSIIEISHAPEKVLPVPVNSPSILIDTSAVKIEPTPAAPATVWDRLFSLYALPEIENDRVEQQLQEYLKYPKYLAKIQRRAAPYLHYILDEIEEKQIPGELALLPVVESAFNPQALSHSQASGLWQFIPATGRLFGLKQNWWYDGRRDVYTSTQAATKYLKQLSRSFDNDWFLALASFNAGKGNIRKAIRKNKRNNLPADYWSLPLPRETRNYIPRLLAIAKIFANADKYNIPLLNIPDTPHFTVVDINSQIDLALAAKMAKTPIDEFFLLNPAFKRGSTDPDGPFHLLIHTDKADEFEHQLANTSKKDRLKWLRHRIKSGENLGQIARKYNTTVNALIKGNRLANSRIRAGKMLLIPSSLANTSHHGKRASQKFYTVKKGDTFWDIARQFDVRSKDLASWNNISLNKILRPGQKLIIKES